MSLLIFDEMIPYVLIPLSCKWV